MLLTFCEWFMEHCARCNLFRMDRTRDRVKLHLYEEPPLGAEDLSDEERDELLATLHGHVMTAVAETARGFHKQQPFIVLLHPDKPWMLLVPATKRGNRAKGPAILLREEQLGKSFVADGWMRFCGPLIEQAFAHAPYSRMDELVIVPCDDAPRCRYPSIYGDNLYITDHYTDILESWIGEDKVLVTNEE